MTKNYIIRVNPFDVPLDQIEASSERIALLTLEFGRVALTDVWRDVRNEINHSGLSDQVEYFDRPNGILPLPFLFMQVSEDVAKHIQGTDIEKVEGVYEMGMPFEVPGWHKHLKLVES